MDGALDIPTRRGVRSRLNILRASVYRRLQPVVLAHVFPDCAHEGANLIRACPQQRSRAALPAGIYWRSVGRICAFLCVTMGVKKNYIKKNKIKKKTWSRLFVCLHRFLLFWYKPQNGNYEVDVYRFHNSYNNNKNHEWAAVMLLEWAN